MWTQNNVRSTRFGPELGGGNIVREEPKLTLKDGIVHGEPKVLAKDGLESKTVAKDGLDH